MIALHKLTLYYPRHLPSKLWQKIKLPKNYQEALSQIEEHLKYWPQYMIHRYAPHLLLSHNMYAQMRKSFVGASGSTPTKVGVCEIISNLIEVAR